MLPAFSFGDGHINMAFTLPIYVGVVGFLISDLLFFGHFLEGKVEEVGSIVFVVSVPPGKIIIVFS